MKEYRLEPLVRLRRGKVDAAARVVSSADAAVVERERERVAAAQRKDIHDATAYAIRSAERVALTMHHLKVDDLRRLGEWQKCSDAIGDHLAAELAELKEAERLADEAASRARSILGGRRADARVVENHREAWRSEQRREEEASFDEEVGEAHEAQRKERT